MNDETRYADLTLQYLGRLKEYDPSQPRDDKGQWTGGGAGGSSEGSSGGDSGGGSGGSTTVGNYKLSQDKTYIRHDAQAKNGDEHFHSIQSQIPEHLQKYIAEQDQKLSDKLQGMELEKRKYEFGSSEADKIFGQQEYLKGLEPERIASRANKLDKLIKNGKAMVSKYSGTGVISGRPIKSGDKIYYSGGGTGAEHADVVDRYRPSK